METLKQRKNNAFSQKSCVLHLLRILLCALLNCCKSHIISDPFIFAYRDNKRQFIYLLVEYMWCVCTPMTSKCWMHIQVHLATVVSLPGCHCILALFVLNKQPNQLALLATSQQGGIREKNYCEVFLFQICIKNFQHQSHTFMKKGLFTINPKPIHTYVHTTYSMQIITACNM